jgi:hypothetical protein
MRQRLSRRQELWVYGVGGLLALTGAAWLVCHYFLRGDSPAPNPLEVWWLRLHGAAVVGFLIIFGSVLPGHVLHGWRHHRNRVSGTTLVTVISMLASSGYGLYYIVDDDQRSWVSIIHWVVGLLSVAAIVIHAVLGKRAQWR